MAPIQGLPQDKAGGTTGARSSAPWGFELSAITLGHLRRLVHMDAGDVSMSNACTP
jgi:hypothetical protein